MAREAGRPKALEAGNAKPKTIPAGQTTDLARRTGMPGKDPWSAPRLQVGR
jgi:hypothetical protein